MYIEFNSEWKQHTIKVCNPSGGVYIFFFSADKTPTNTIDTRRVWVCFGFHFSYTNNSQIIFKKKKNRTQNWLQNVFSLPSFSLSPLLSLSPFLIVDIWLLQTSQYTTNFWMFYSCVSVRWGDIFTGSSVPSVGWCAVK